MMPPVADNPHADDSRSPNNHHPHHPSHQQRQERQRRTKSHSHSINNTAKEHAHTTNTNKTNNNNNKSSKAKKQHKHHHSGATSVIQLPSSSISTSKPKHKRTRSVSETNNQQKLSMDPPGDVVSLVETQHNPADLLKELYHGHGHGSNGNGSDQDAVVTQQQQPPQQQMNNNGNRGILSQGSYSASSSVSRGAASGSGGSNGVGIHDLLGSGDTNNDDGSSEALLYPAQMIQAASAPQAQAVAPSSLDSSSKIPAKQQLSALRSKYFQPKRSITSGSASAVGGGGGDSSSRTMVTASMTTAHTDSGRFSDYNDASTTRFSNVSSSFGDRYSSGGNNTTNSITNEGSAATTSSRGGGGGGRIAKRNDVTDGIGTYTIPTFKSDNHHHHHHHHEATNNTTSSSSSSSVSGGVGNRLSQSEGRSSMRSSGRRSASERLRNGSMKAYRMVDTNGNRISSAASDAGNNNNNNNNNYRSSTTPTTNVNRRGTVVGEREVGRKQPREKFTAVNTNTMEEFSMDDDDNNWMEDALLNGITAANSTEDNGELLLGIDATDQSSISRRELLGQLLGDSSSSIRQPPQTRNKYMPKSRGGQPQQQQEEVNQQQQHRTVKFNSGATERRRSSIEDLTNPNITMADLLKYASAKTSSSASNNSNHPTSEQQVKESALRRTRSNPKERANNNKTPSSSSPSRSPPARHHHRSLPAPPTPQKNDNDDTTTALQLVPDDNNSLVVVLSNNIPILPTIKTYKVVKTNPSEPAGLFLTKAKNGAVLVHSLSPESLFRKSTPLHPGQEVLSVNEKRVNDPKMAARLITQAKKILSLRISTVERSRGFMYCQVKRRSGGSGGAVAAAAAVQESSAISPGGANTPGSTDGVGKDGGGAGAGGVGGKNTTKKRGRTGGGGGGVTNPSHHGVRFITTSIDGVRRGTITEGLVRVSHIDPLGLFANSHPMNRLRVGGIVLTVNGTPVTNGRMALEKVMGSRQLVEVLHCDERVWREDWVKDGLERVLSGQQKDPNESTNDLLGGMIEGGENPQEKSVAGGGRSSSLDGWELEWRSEREQVILRQKKKGGNYAFKLIFNNDVGTCHPELVDEDTMMPPTDEFDVSLLVQTVNESQRTMMTVLQNMLRKAVGSGAGGRRKSSSRSRDRQATANKGGNAIESSTKPLPIESSTKPVGNSWSSSRQVALIDSSSRQIVQTKTEATEDLVEKIDDGYKRERLHSINSCDVLTELVEGDNGEVDDELSQLAESLLRVDSRDRKRNTLRATHGPNSGMSDTKQAIPRRGSTGFDMAIPGLSHADIEQWRLERWENNQQHDDDHALTSNKIRNFSAKQHKLEEYSEQHHHQPSGQSRAGSVAGSLFSTDMLDDFLDYLDDVDINIGHTPGNSSDEEDDDNNESPPSPRDDAHKWEENEALQYAISPAHSEPTPQDDDYEESSPMEKKGDDEMAYITGVWRDVGSKYEISDKVVGSGGFGEVRDCYDKKTGAVYVVKTIFKPSQDDTTKVNLIRNEILLLHEAHHPNIVELRDLFEDDKYVHIVMERCMGGDLFDRVVNENPRRLRSPADAMKHEARTANSMRSVLHVLKYLHSKGIVHRDIKPEHFLLTTEERETQKIKLIDFGLARKHKAGSVPMTTFTGSPSFVAPEVIARSYDHMCDMFSVGVTAYFLLTGMLPFDGPTDEETFDLISAGKFKFPSSSVFLSDEAKDFVTKLLRIDPSKRMSAGKALNHPWLLKAASC